MVVNAESDPRLERVERFFAGTGATYDHIVHVFTLGIDRLWKNRILGKLFDPSHVMDLACGTGILTFAVAKRFPNCRVVGVELREEYLGIARKKAKEFNIENVEFILSRAEDVLLNEQFDAVISSYLAKYADLKPLVRNLTRMLRENGLLLFHDFTYPAHPMLAAGWELYFKLLQRFASKKYPEWRNVFYELPPFLRQTNWVKDLRSAMQENNLTAITEEYLTLGASAILTAVKPAAIPADRLPEGSHLS